VDQPIACSLDATDRQGRIEEWRAWFGANVTELETPTATRVRMRLDSDEAAIDALVALARQEVECCPFFSFAVEIDAEGLVFTTAVPPEAAPVLEAFARLATP
jgi:hypothetical protein